MFRRANEQPSTLKKAPSKGCETSKLRDHFKSHFNLTYDNDTQPPELFENPPLFVENLLEITSAIQVDTSVPTIDELRKIILSLKNGKVASDLPPELLKYAAFSDEFLNEVYVVMAEIWTNRRLSADWGISRITTLWKNKGKESDPSKYRGLSISSAICKLCMSIDTLRSRLPTDCKPQFEVCRLPFAVCLFVRLRFGSSFIFIFILVFYRPAYISVAIDLGAPCILFLSLPPVSLEC